MLRAPIIAWLALPLMLASQPSAAQAQGPYLVKPSQVALPHGAELGSYRRTIQPFENWELICDEDLSAMTKVCNVTQTITDATGALIFGWSLAATEQGEPMMIIRTNSDIAAGHPVRLHFPTTEQPVVVDVTGCDASVCTALLAVNLPLKQLIADGATIAVSYATGAGERVLHAPLEGLNTALQAI